MIGVSIYLSAPLVSESAVMVTNTMVDHYGWAGFSFCHKEGPVIYPKGEGGIIRRLVEMII